jgi:beta-glucosidase/6-phospho-beta-glucosidase/beta-galactosidase
MKLFNTFFMGGYECADMINNRGNRVDLLVETAHDSRIVEDYQLLKQAGILTVREGIRWSVVEKTPYVYDFSEVINRIQAAQEAGIQQCWDICHFGYPDGLIPSHPQFLQRFVGVCTAFTKLFRQLSDEILFITPINEISFMSWLGGDVRGTVPFAIHSGFDVKYFLCRAAIAGIKAIKEIDPQAQVMMVEPLIRVHCKEGEQPNDHIRGINESQYQAMDMVTGRMCPELGGRPDLLDLAGFNFYYNNQWEHCGPFHGWRKHHRKTSLADILLEAYQRYGKPVVLSETGHFKEDRTDWMLQITDDCIDAMEMGVDLRGICIYPVLDRPDWDHLEYITCGIWGYDEHKNRTVETEYLKGVKDCIKKMDSYLEQRSYFKQKHKAKPVLA